MESDVHYFGFVGHSYNLLTFKSFAFTHWVGESKITNNVIYGINFTFLPRVSYSIYPCISSTLS